MDLFYEAAVGGAIPIVRGVRVSLAGDTVSRILGIVNGTTNYVLDEMTREHLAFDEAVAQAQRLGYAEADPTADVEGFGAASKAAILASLAFHTRISIDRVSCEEISAITPADVEAVRANGYAIKLLAIVERAVDDAGTHLGVIARVHPALVPLDHPLASVRGAFNAVFTESEAAGPLMFYGQGAGGVARSSAVLGDVVAAARHRMDSPIGPGESAYTGLKALPIGLARTRYQVRLIVADRPGVLAAVAQVFAAHGCPSTRSANPPSGRSGNFGESGHHHPHGRRCGPVRHRGRTRSPRSGRFSGRGHPGRGSLGRGAHLARRDRRIRRPPAAEARRAGRRPGGGRHSHGSGSAAVRHRRGGYATRAGMTCAVLVPEGKIAMGKLPQAVAHGARLPQLDGNFDDCLVAACKLSEAYPVELVNAVNPYRIEGHRTAAFEIVDALGDAPAIHALPVGNAGNITAYWKGYRECAAEGLATRTPAMWGF
ncbi:MAG: homoserine dehydrogenase [Bifidobacteriaceae bacterium]|nr:homoserine dehydrogenase [Bifidobacteriaceae bacterium]